MDKNISIIGVGKLGLCLGLNLETKGYQVLGIDVNESYVNLLKNKTLKSSEPFVEQLLQKSSNMEFSTQLSRAVESDTIFIVVATPSTSEWKYDHTQIEQVVNELVKLGKQPIRKDLVINCTTFPGYCEDLHKRLKPYNYYVSYNPEFIAQGSIIKDQLNCDSVLIGEADKIAGDKIEKIYKDLCESNPYYNRMSCTESEIVKLATNCFLTTKISFANMVGDIASRLNCNANTVLKAIGTDSRVGSKYIKPGFGFGGPCFPRDNRALAKCGEELGIDAVVSKATDEMNEKHLQYQIEDFVKNNPDKTKEIEIEYVTYKKDSVLLEESQQLKFALKLKELGYTIKILDQREEVLNQLKNVL